MSNECSDCGGPVEYILGEWHCSGCGVVFSCEKESPVESTYVDYVSRTVEMPNRAFRSQSFNVNGRSIEVRAMIDRYPLPGFEDKHPSCDIITYRLTVRKKGTIIERTMYAACQADTMWKRIEEWRNMQGPEHYKLVYRDGPIIWNVHWRVMPMRGCL